MHVLPALALAVCISLTCAPSLAFYPIIDNVSVTVTPPGEILISAHDPLRDRNETYYANSGLNTSIPVWINKNGIVAWINQYPSSSYVSFGVYDPALGYWQVLRSPGFLQVDQLTVDNGVVSWVDTRPANLQYFHYYTYDPKLGKWVGIDESSFITGVAVNHDGVVAYDYTSLTIFTGVYDPYLSQWQVELAFVPEGPRIINIQDATVVISLSGSTMFRGYNPDTLSWYWGQTKPLAYFLAQPASKQAPMWTWITDMSIACNWWSWDFGDSQGPFPPIYLWRSAYHIFKKPGNYLCWQYISGPAGQASVWQSIQVPGAGLGYLPLLLAE